MPAMEPKMLLLSRTKISWGVVVWELRFGDLTSVITKFLNQFLTPASLRDTVRIYEKGFLQPVVSGLVF